MKRHPLSLARALAVTLVASAITWSAAQPLNYAPRNVQIRAGVLLIESQRTQQVGGVPYNPAPHVWGQLDLDNTIKPANWTFVNPVGSPTLIPSARQRWSDAPAAGSRLTKRTASYWEVQLSSTSDQVLSRFNVLLLPLERYVSLNPLERERLRRYVDQGGVLWVDVLPANSQRLFEGPNSLPIPFTLRGGTGDYTFNGGHPLMSFPYEISERDLSQMVDISAADAIVSYRLADDGLGALGQTQAWLEADSDRLEDVAGYANGATIRTAKLGEGYMVVTTGGLSLTLNRATNNGVINRNLRYLSGPPVLDGPFASAAKLVVNAVSLASGHTMPAGGSRKTNSNPIDLTAPLLRRSNTAVGGNLNDQHQPVIARGRVIVTTSSRVLVLDSSPTNDLNGDGDPDDGFQDPAGSAQDVIWRSSDLPSPISAAAYADVPDSAVNGSDGPVTNQILVTDGNGVVHIFDLNALGDNIGSVAQVNPPDAARRGGTPFAPTIHDGIAFVGDVRNQDGLGRIWLIDLRTARFPSGPNPWVIQGTARMTEPGASPTVGYVPIFDNSGGVDRVVYVPTRNITGGLPGSSRPAGITSIWMGARGERPTFVQQTGATIVVTTRASGNGLPVNLNANAGSLGVKISLMDADGNPVTPQRYREILTGTVSSTGVNGQIQFGLTGAGQALDWDGLKTPNDPNDDMQVRIDYTIDWTATGQGQGNLSDLFIRGNIEFPDDNQNAREIIGNAALAANGNIFLVVGTRPQTGTGGGGPANSGAVYCLREEGRGEFKILMRWELFPNLQIRLNESSGQPTDVPYRSTVQDEDWLSTNPPFSGIFGGPLNELRFTGGPTIAGDSVYVTISGRKGFIPVPVSSAVIAFRVDPPPPSFLVENIQQGFVLAQPDPARSSNKTRPDAFSFLQAGQYTYEPDPAGGPARVRMTNLAPTTRGRLRDVLISNLPVIVRVPGSPDILLEPELEAGNSTFVAGRANGSWNPMRWYTIFNGFTATTQPMVTGETMFLAGLSYAPDLFRGNFPPTRSNAIVYAMTTQISPNDPFVKPISIRPWERQLNQFQPDPPGPPGFKVTDAILWPQARGVESFDDFRVRLLQNTMPESSARNVAAGDGVLVVTGQSNVYMFGRSDFLIADEGRVSRFDANGNPVWSTDASLSSGNQLPTAAVGQTVPVSGATKIYPAGLNQYWVVDTANDRVVRLESSGRELRTISGFIVDPNWRPNGLLDSANPRLRRPLDALTFTSIRTAQNNPFSNAYDRELWVHHLIADSGNFRLVELVDRYQIDNRNRVIGVVQYLNPDIPPTERPRTTVRDRNNQNIQVNERALGVIFWHSPSELSGKQYSYNSIDRTLVADQNGVRRPVVAFGFGNFEPGRQSFGLDGGGDVSSGYGGVVLYDAQGRSDVITSFQVPAIGANVFWDENTQTFNSPARPARVQKISGLSSVTLQYVNDAGTPRLTVMITDNSGVYELIDPDNNPNTPWVVRWMLPNESFRVMRRSLSNNRPFNLNGGDLRASYAKRLDSEEVLVVNRFVGRTRGGAPYNGEVVLIDGSFENSNVPREPGFNWNKINLGFNSLSVNYELPPVQGARGLVAPLFAFRQ